MKGGRFPIKWMALESLLDGISTPKSDVYVFYHHLLIIIIKLERESCEIVSPPDMSELNLYSGFISYGLCQSSYFCGLSSF